MPIERYFIDSNLENNARCKLIGNEFHHLSHVMRTRVGDEIELVNGKGALAIAILNEIKKEHAIVDIRSITFSEAPFNQLILAQALPKPNRLDYILEKGTELGVTEFWLFPGQLSIKKELFPNQVERARALTIAAMKQCGCLFLPRIAIKKPLLHWEKLENCSAFFGDTRSDAPLLRGEMQTTLNSSVVFFIGPESGFTDQENGQLKELNAKGVKLHQNTLRTDTASISAMSLVSHFLIK